MDIIFSCLFRNDIEDLESTFVRLGLDENGRVREDRGGNTVPGIIGGNSLNASKGRAIRLEKIHQNQNGGIGLTPARDVSIYLFFINCWQLNILQKSNCMLL